MTTYHDRTLSPLGDPIIGRVQHPVRYGISNIDEEFECFSEDPPAFAAHQPRNVL